MSKKIIIKTKSGREIIKKDVVFQSIKDVVKHFKESSLFKTIGCLIFEKAKKKYLYYPEMNRFIDLTKTLDNIIKTSDKNKKSSVIDIININIEKLGSIKVDSDLYNHIFNYMLDEYNKS